AGGAYLRRLVPGHARQRTAHRQDGQGDAAGCAAGARAEERWAHLRHAGSLSASWDSAVGGLVRWRDGAVQVPWLAVRAVRWAVPGDSFADELRDAGCFEDLCGCVSVRGARWICVGLSAGA